MNKGEAGVGFRGKSRGCKEGTPKGHRGGRLEEAHTLICHVLVCLRSSKVSPPVTRSNPGDNLVHCHCPNV